MVVTGSGAAFSAGADLREVQSMLDAKPPELWSDAEAWCDLYKVIPTLAKPVVAAVNGPAVAGGCGLVAACDLAIASERARFGVPEIKIGLFPSLILPSLIRAIGTRNTLGLVLTGRTIDAQEALRMGLVGDVVEHDRLEETAARFASSLVELGSLNSRIGKQAVYRMAEMDAAGAMELARALRVTFLSSPELRHGLERFLARG